MTKHFFEFRVRVLKDAFDILQLQLETPSPPAQHAGLLSAVQATPQNQFRRNNRFQTYLSFKLTTSKSKGFTRSSKTPENDTKTEISHLQF